MKMEPILQELEAAADALRVAVKYEALSSSVGSGGLCKVKGAYRVIIDKRATTAERIATLARSLAQLDIEMPAEIRATIHRYAGTQPDTGRQAS